MHVRRYGSHVLFPKWASIRVLLKPSVAQRLQMPSLPHADFPCVQQPVPRLRGLFQPLSVCQGTSAGGFNHQSFMVYSLVELVQPRNFLLGVFLVFHPYVLG